MSSGLLDAPVGEFTAAQTEELSVENARLRAEVEALQGRNEALASAVAWFRDGLEDDNAREAMTRRMCEDHLVPQVAGNAGPGRSTASPTHPSCPSASSSPLSLGAVAAVLAAEQMPSALSERQLAAAAVACRAVVTLGEVTQARLTRELAWRYQWRDEQGLDVGTGAPLELDGRVPDWLRDIEDKAVTVAVAEVAALARMSPNLLAARVELVTRYRDEHPAIFAAVMEGRLSTGRARLIAREVERLPGTRERWWVTDRILPMAESMGEGGLRRRLERLIAQADPEHYRRLLDDADAEQDTVSFTKQGYGKGALTYTGSISRVARLVATLRRRAAQRMAGCAEPGGEEQAQVARDRSAIAQAQTLFDLITDPDTMPPDLIDPAGTDSEDTASSSTDSTGTDATGTDATGNDSTDPDSTDPDSTSTASTSTASTSTDTADTRPTSAGSAPCTYRGGVRVLVEPKVSLHVTIPLQVLQAIWSGQPVPTAFGLAELAGVEGLGAIPPRALASLVAEHGARATWRCQVLDDRPGSATFGTIIGTGRPAIDPTYRPSAALTALTRAQRPRCVFPGCHRPAVDCDLDHAVPHGRGGATSDANLAPLCRFHHLLKTFTGFTPQHDPTTGATTWRTPSGHQLSEAADTPPPLRAEGCLPGAWPVPDRLGSGDPPRPAPPAADPPF